MTAKGNISVLVGRFNPFTVYHRELIQRMDGHRMIITTSSHDVKNPLTLSTKREMLDSALHEIEASQPNRPIMLVTTTGGMMNALKDAASAVHEIMGTDGNVHITLHCGTDRAEAYHRLNTYTNETGVVIDSIVVHERCDESHSATYLRLMAKMGRWDEFNAMCGFIPADKHTAYCLIQKHYAGLQG